MSPLVPIRDQKQFSWRALLTALLAGLFGVVLLLVAMFAIQPLLPPGQPPRTADLLVIAGALIQLTMGIVMTYVHLIRPADAPMPRARLAQVATYLLAAVALLLPIIGPHILAPGLAFMVVLVLYVVITGVAWKIWREADELMRAILRDASVAAFHVTTVALAIYASGERLGVLSGGSAWGFLGFVLFANVMCSCWAVYRHGAEQPLARE